MSRNHKPMSEDYITLFLSGDVMTGRGIDQVLPHPGNPRLYEPYVRNARHYVSLAEQANGKIPAPVGAAYIWGDALQELASMAPEWRIVNLETSVTTSEEFWSGKGIHYRMHPDNIACLTAAEIDCCVLANNHVMDWGHEGLTETIRTLQDAGINTSGAGQNQQAAALPAALSNNKGRVLIFAYGLGSSGVPPDWQAGTRLAGINRLPDLSSHSMERVKHDILSHKQPGDIVIVSLHWGSNWGYHIDSEQIAFAHALIDQSRVDIIHGHSSHHPRAMEVYRDKIIFYGCGDLLNDYEGIAGNESYRDDLSLMYFVTLARNSGNLARLEMVPMQIRQFRLNRASASDSNWLTQRLSREGKRFANRVTLEPSKRLILHW